MATIGATVKIFDEFSNPLEKLNSSLSRSKSSMSSFKSAFKDGFNGNIQQPLEGVGQQAEKTSGIFKKMLCANVIGTGITKGIDRKSVV